MEKISQLPAHWCRWWLPDRIMIALFLIASFLSAFLLFAIQPLMAKALLPALGGSALVWGTCMVCFQGLLFLGYLASHWVLQRWAIRVYLWMHFLAIGVAVAIMRPFGIVEVTPGEAPWLATLWVCLKHVGLPFFLLSFSTPLLQRWLAELGNANPYRLFSYSNAGSLLALGIYPFLIEPHLPLTEQSVYWRYGAALLLVILVVMRLTSDWKTNEANSVKANGRVRFQQWGKVLALSASSCGLLLAVTNAITFDVSSAPLLWVLPLALYLLTFVVVFKRRPWMGARLSRTSLPWWLAGGLILFLMGRFHLGFHAGAGVVCHLAVVAFGCWLAHARLAQLKPEDPGALTGYYVAMSAGGLVGSALVSWVVPLLASAFVEYPMALAGIVLSVAVNPGAASWRERFLRVFLGILAAGGLMSILAWTRPAWLDPVVGFAVIAGLLLILCLYRRDHAWLSGIALAVWLMVGPTKATLWEARRSEHFRNFYGIYEVSESGERRYLTHGTTNHGIQNLEVSRRAEPLSYYHRGGPAGELLSGLEPRRRRFGMIGLGAGSMVAYAKSEDTFAIFELDPLNIELARSRFSYLADGATRGVAIQVLQGDGRLLLQKENEREGKGNVGGYDVLILDAFSSGAIPMHLLTREAVAAYLESLAPDGVVLMHISNRALRLRPLVASVAQSVGRTAYFRDSEESVDDVDLKSSDWALLGASEVTARRMAERFGWLPWGAFSGEGESLPRPWTDETGDLLSVWRWRE